MADIPEVLFVCTHNAGRSQMAAALLDREATGRVRVTSAGSQPADQLNPAVVQAMTEIGLDISREFPKPLTTDKVQAADVVITIRMPRLDGLEATRRLTGSTGVKVLVLTTYDLDEYVFEALRAGASGFLLKDSPPDTLISGIATVARGDALLAPSVTRRLITEFARRPAESPRPVLPDLTPRETEVLIDVAQGPVQPRDRRTAPSWRSHHQDLHRQHPDETPLP